MKELIKRTVQMICVWLKAMREESRKRRAEKRKKARMRECCQMVQVKEFGGILYVSFDGVPLVDTNCLVDKIPEALDDIRSTYAEWLEGGRL